MSLNANDYKAPSSGPKYTAEEGIQAAVIVQVIGLGLQDGGQWQGKEKDPVHKVMVTYELVDEVHDFDGEEKPLLQSETFPISNHEKSKCMARLNALDPGLKKTGGDLSKLVGMPCAVQIGHKEGEGKHAGKTFVNILSVAKPGRSMKIDTDTFNEQFSYNPYEHDEDVWDLMHEWIRDKIDQRLDKGDQDTPTPAKKSSKAKDKPEPEPEGGVDLGQDEDEDW